ncbi:MAG: hypothetical protein HC905_10365 [Bacteroidales bacterium]|nr:hypothetical protein [Bacteroidales bacterium]
MNTNDRRKFLKTGLLAAGIIPVIGSELKSSGPLTTIKKADNDFVYRTLGKTGLKVPVISMGAGDTTNPKLVEAAWTRA